MIQGNQVQPDELRFLIDACIQNESKAQIRLYEIFAKTMYNTSRRIVKDSMVAEDIVQESFLAAFRALERYSHDVPFDAWLRRIVINRSIDHLRKQHIVFEELHEGIHSAIQEPDWNTGYESQEILINEIKKQVANLPEGYRVIFSLFYLEGYDHDEISQILNISPSTSRSQLTRAKRKLIELMHKVKSDHVG